MENKKKVISIISVILLIIAIILPLFNYRIYGITQTISSNINSLDESIYPGVKSMITNLQSKHPNWTFKILYTDLEWSDVIAGEYQGHGTSPKNLVQNISNYKGEWICPICKETPYDNGSWRCASEAAIAYMMDPRNSLNDTDIFQFEELTSSNCNIDNIKSMTKGTYLEGHEQGIVDASIQNGVNGIYVVARLIQEQGSDGSELVSGEQGYYNAFNIGASGNTKQEIINNGIAYAKRQGWDTLEKSIIGGIGFVANNYIKKGQNTLYLQKFNVTTNSGGPYTHQYQQNILAAQSEGTKLRDTYIKANAYESAHTFVIPVYKNMPSEISKRPNGDGNTTVNSDVVKVNVNSSLRIRNEPNGTETVGWVYSNEIVTRIEKATEKIAGTYWDKIRKSNGITGYVARETYDYENPYKLYLVPINEGGETDDPSTTPDNPETPNNPGTTPDNPSTPGEGTGQTPTNTDKVKFEENTKTIIVKPGAIAQDILDAFGGSVKIVKADGNFLENEQSVMGTGYIVEDIYTVVKAGDVNGDGTTNSLDAAIILKYTVKQYTLENCYYQAGCLDNTKAPTALDAAKILKYTVGQYEINI